MSDILVKVARFPAVWKGKKLKREFGSLLGMISLHFEVAVSRFTIIPLRQLKPLRGVNLRPRLKQDVQVKEELMQLAARMGAASTASRLNASFRAFQTDASAGLQQRSELRGRRSCPAIWERSTKI